MKAWVFRVLRGRVRSISRGIRGAKARSVARLDARAEARAYSQKQILLSVHIVPPIQIFSLSIIISLCSLPDDMFSVHVGDEGVGDADGAVGLLIVFEDGEVGAADGEAAAVEGVDELGFFLAGGFEADVGAAGLEGLEVRAGRYFAVEILSGEPDLEVLGFGGREAHVGGAEEHAAVGQAEEFEDALGVAGETLVLLVGLVGTGELD